MKNTVSLVLILCPATTLLAVSTPLDVIGGPAFDPLTGTGFRDPFVPFQQAGVSSGGVGVGYATKRGTGFLDLGRRAFRWDDNGTVELVNLSTTAGGFADTVANATNAGGTIVGSSRKYDSGASLGYRAVYWNASSNAPIELGHLGTNPSGVTNAQAVAINASLTKVGVVEKFSGSLSLGERPVRWNPGNETAIELAVINTDLLGRATAGPLAINAAGTIVGTGIKYDGNRSLGNRAVRWDAGGTAISSLNSLSLPPDGLSYAYAFAVDGQGSAYGYSQKYDGETLLGERAIRWDHGTTVPTELDNLGTATTGFAYSTVFAVTDSGTAVGYADKFDENGVPKGLRAVRWNAGTSDAIQLGDLGTDSRGVTIAIAHAINNGGVASGFCWKYENDVALRGRAVIWLPDGSAIDLNTLIDPTTGWTLTSADTISDTNFVAGIGTFDPDGIGPLNSYSRAFLLDVSSVVPEPFALTPALVAMLLLRRRRNGRISIANSPSSLP